MMALVKFIILCIATVLGLIYIVLLLAGSKYDSYIQGLPSKGYSDKELFSAGFKLEELPMFSMKSPLGQKLMQESALMHPENEGRYAEYWARLYMARALSLPIMVLAIFSGISVSMPNMFMMFAALAAGVVAAYAMYDSGVNGLKKDLQKRSDDCLLEFSNMVSKLSLLLNCNMTLHNAWFSVAYSKEGVLYDLMRQACDEMNNGVGDVQAIYDFGVLSNNQEIKKFASILIQSITKGGSDITIYLRQQSQELWSQKKQILLRKGDEANARLIGPTMMFLAGIMMIIMAGAYQSMNFSF